MVLGFAAICLLLSCSKDSTKVPGAPTGKAAKFTITVNGALHSDYLTFVFAGVSSTSNTTVWKVNGVTQNNQQGITLDQDDFTGNVTTYVVETVMPVEAIAASIQCLAYGDRNYTVSYKAEIDGVVKNNDENITVAEHQDYTHQFSY